METVNEMLRRAHDASAVMCDVDDSAIERVLIATADNLVAASDRIIEANERDLARMDAADPMYDRLLLNAERIGGIAADMRNVATLPSPVGRVLSTATRPNGMKITKISVPLGVVGVIYEARPNVTADVFSLCLKSGNVAVLKGGSNANDSNMAICEVIGSTLESFGLGRELCTLLPATREAAQELLHAEGLVDLVIPRGSRGLIDFVRREATIPVIETGAGVCHVYFDKAGDATKGAAIIDNAKTRRVSVCNALDCLVMHRERLADLPALCAPMAKSNVVIYADGEAYAALGGHYPAALLQHSSDEHYGREFQDYKLAIRTVGDIYEALAHIARYGSKHSESIITEDKSAASLFTRRVDAACVYTNLPTSFSDGAQFGFGAEIGISTQKLHARGPMALPELTTYKYIVEGDGQIRKP